MARKPKPPAGPRSDESYRKPNKMVRIRGPLIAAVEDRVKDLAQDATQYVNDAVRMRLEAEGQWPPKK